MDKNNCALRFNQITLVVLMLMVSSAFSQLGSYQQRKHNLRNPERVSFPDSIGENPTGPSASDAAVHEKNDKRQEVLVDAITKFSLDMTKSLLEEEDGNFVVSPVSLATVLSLLYQGSTENTKTASELHNVLGMTRTGSKTAFRKFLNDLKGGPASREMIFKNAVFVEGAQLDSAFKQVAANAYHADIIDTLFKNPIAASSSINNWVNKVTKGKIPSLVEPGSLDSSTQCVLTNAVYFKNVWKTVFDTSRTTKKQFNINAGVQPTKNVMVDFMQQSGKMVTGSDKKLQARWVKVPFDDNVYSMVFVLPMVQDGLDDMIKNLKPEDLKSIIETTNIQTTHLGIPKFKIGYSKSLVNVLSKMGVNSIFDPQNRDLTKIVQNRPIYVSDALQKAVISIDEQGVTAAAATALTINTLSLASYYDEVRFLADQPFLVMILKDTIPIFMAKIKDPSLLV